MMCRSRFSPRFSPGLVPARRGSVLYRCSCATPAHDCAGCVALHLIKQKWTGATEATAAIQNPAGATMYRRHNKPALGPPCDSLDDIEV